MTTSGYLLCDHEIDYAMPRTEGYREVGEYLAKVEESSWKPDVLNIKKELWAKKDFKTTLVEYDHSHRTAFGNRRMYVWPHDEV